MTFALLMILPVIGWTSAVILVRAARVPPAIASLNERALAAVIIAAFTTLYAIVVVNTDVLHTFNQDAIRTVLRLSVVVLGLVPVRWVFLYISGRFGGDS